MKSLLLSLFVLSSAAQAATVPSQQTFDQVFNQASKLRYIGTDVLVCTSGNGKVVVGGVAHWGLGLQIYLVDAQGAVTPTQRISPKDEEGPQKFSANGQEVVLNLGEFTGIEGEGFNQVQKFGHAILAMGAAEMAQQLSCFRMVSGLE